MQAEPAATPPRHALLDVSDVSLAAGGRQLLDRVSLALAPGEIVTLIGPNGAGKTTLVRVLLGLLTPDTGRITRAPGLRIGYVPQRFEADPVLPLTVARFLRLGGSVDGARVEVVLGEVGVPGRSGRALAALSGGELRRVLLARALLREPQLLVLDEPAQAVDVGGQHELYELIARLRRERGCAVLLVSHDLHLVMAATDHVICLNTHVCCQGHPELVSRDPAYRALFPAHIAASLALYTHAHDHRHDLGNGAPHG